MIIISQFEDKITESLEFSIEEKESNANIIIPADILKKYKKTVRKKDDNYFSLEELKEIGKLLGKKTTTIIYVIIEIKSNRIFGVFGSKGKAKRELRDIADNVGKGIKYQIKKDTELGISFI